MKERVSLTEEPGLRGSRFPVRGGGLLTAGAMAVTTICVSVAAVGLSWLFARFADEL